MKKIFAAFLISVLIVFPGYSQTKLDTLLPVRGLCIAAPDKEHVDPFIKFIRDELIPMNVNTLVLRVDFSYEYESRPELADSGALSKNEVKKIVEACKAGNIRLIPQVNLLGHQSWHGDVGRLLEVYPQFNETPYVELPAEGEYEWPNEYGLYCLSYCPLHPDVHEVVFDIVDEIVEVFETDAFHAGMDEVFYLGDDKCPRCSGRDPAELFAGEVTKIRNHLALNDRKLWIWGDRLIDGKTTGLGIWEASMNNTYRAIDMIPRDVVINDWHYNRAVPTAAYFAIKGFNVITCPWRRSEVAEEQLKMILNFRENSSSEMKDRFQGMMQTVWTGAGNFMDYYYKRKEQDTARGSSVECFKELFVEINALR